MKLPGFCPGGWGGVWVFSWSSARISESFLTAPCLWSFLAAQTCSKQLISITETNLNHCLEQINKLLCCKGW